MPTLAVDPGIVNIDVNDTGVHGVHACQKVGATHAVFIFAWLLRAKIARVVANLMPVCRRCL